MKPYLVVKRVLDLIFAVFFLIIFSPIMLIASIAIKMDSQGPVLFKQQRPGKDAKVFTIYKFRTMRVETEKDGKLLSDSDRITRVGAVLRKTSIDELPQLINILKGEMSFIGPRPDPVDWLSRYSDAERIFLDVKPGITGYNQAYFRNSADGREKIKNDVFYAQNLSLALDLKILFITFFTVLTRKDVFKRPESISSKSDGV